MPVTRFMALWRNIRHRAGVERELDEEMRATIDLLVAENLRVGMAPDAARRAALLHIGGVESVKQQVRDVRRGAFVDSSLRDLRYAARLLWRNPLFALTAVLSLAIGIGATTAIFSVVHAVILRPLPFERPDQLVSIQNLWTERGVALQSVSAPDFHDWKAQSTSFESMGYYTGGEWSVTVNGAADYAMAYGVTPGFFEALRAQAALGRLRKACIDALGKDDPEPAARDRACLFALRKRPVEEDDPDAFLRLLAVVLATLALARPQAHEGQARDL